MYSSYSCMLAASSAGDTIGRYRLCRRREISTVLPHGLVGYASAPRVHCSVNSSTCTDTRDGDISSLQAQRQLEDINEYGTHDECNCGFQCVACLLTPSPSIVGTAVPQVCLQPLKPHGPPATQIEPLTTRIADVKRRACSRLLTALSMSLCTVGHAQCMRRTPKTPCAQMLRVPNGYRTVGGRSRR